MTTLSPKHIDNQFGNYWDKFDYEMNNVITVAYTRYKINEMCVVIVWTDCPLIVAEY